MTADIIQAQYEQLEKIAARFQQISDSNVQLQAQVKSRVEALQNGGWQGQGADSFFAEMHEDVFPATQRLAAALSDASKTTRQIRQVLIEAEQEAAFPFRNGEAGGPGSGVDRAVKGKKEGGEIRIKGFKPISNGKLFVAGSGDEKSITFKIPEFMRDFFGGKAELTFKSGAIHPNDISQGSIGDCFFVTSLAAAADQRPELIRNAIKDNGDGTFTVTFYEKKGGVFGIGAEYKPVEVEVKPQLPNGETYSKKHGWISANTHLDPADTGPAGETEMWPHVLEQAYAKWKGGGDLARGYKILNEGGASHNVLEALSGRDSIDKKPHGYSLNELADMKSKGYAMTISSLSSKDGKGSWYRDDTLVRGHAYWIESIDKNAGTVTVRNPWGYSNSKKNKIVIKYEDLDENFRRVTVNPLR